jgi:hypothetical protein
MYIYTPWCGPNQSITVTSDQHHVLAFSFQEKGRVSISLLLTNYPSVNIFKKSGILVISILFCFFIHLYILFARSDYMYNWIMDHCGLIWFHLGGWYLIPRLSGFAYNTRVQGQKGLFVILYDKAAPIFQRGKTSTSLTSLRDLQLQILLQIYINPLVMPRTICIFWKVKKLEPRCSNRYSRFPIFCIGQDLWSMQAFKL